MRFINFQVQLVVPTLEQGHPPLACPPAAHIYIAVIGIAGKAMPLSFQHPIHLVEKHIGQQRREWTALRCALAPFDHHAAIHDARVQVGAHQPDDSGVVHAFP